MTISIPFRILPYGIKFALRLPSYGYFLGGVFGFTLVVGLFGVYYYNRFSGLRVRMEESLHTLDVLLDRRQGQLLTIATLFKRLGLLGENDAKTAIETGRMAMDTRAVPQKALGMAEADEAVQKLFIHSSQYPELQKHAEFEPAHRAIEKTNVEIDGARRYYNALVRDYNVMVNRLPSAVFALLLRYPPADFLDTKP
jgi:LemA protein